MRCNCVKRGKIALILIGIVFSLQGCVRRNASNTELCSDAGDVPPTKFLFLKEDPAVGVKVLPIQTKYVNPVYPRVAKDLRIRGYTVAEILITENGDVTEVDILKSLHPLFDQAVKEAVLQWKFKPATLDGLPVPVKMRTVVRFGCHKRSRIIKSN